MATVIFVFLVFGFILLIAGASSGKKSRPNQHSSGSSNLSSYGGGDYSGGDYSGSSYSGGGSSDGGFGGGSSGGGGGGSDF